MDLSIVMWLRLPEVKMNGKRTHLGGKRTQI